MVRNDVAIIGEILPAQRTLAVLKGDLAIHQLPHLRVGAEFAVTARMLRIIDAADTDLADSSVSGDRFSATTEAGVTNGTDLGATKPHGHCSSATELVRLSQALARKIARVGASGTVPRKRRNIGAPGRPQSAAAQEGALDQRQ